MSRPPQPKSEVNILVIDDTPNNLRLLMKLLGESGYRVRPVTDGAFALAAAKLDPPDLILLDIQMPQIDGYEVCRRLKADQCTREIPVIFLTVLDDIANVTTGFALGAVDYITKPVKAGELIARIDNQIQLKSLQRQLSRQNQDLQHLLKQYQNTEIALRESEEKFSKAFHKSPIPLSIVSIAEGRHLDVNEAFTQETGFTRQEVLGNRVIDLNIWVEMADRSTVLELMATQGSVKNYKTLFRNKVGEIRHVLLSIEIIQLDDTPYFLSATKDITDQTTAEKSLAQRTEELTETLVTLQETQVQLVESAKMAALGNLVAGIAHEINTPVGTAIMMASTLENSTRAIASAQIQSTLTELDFHQYLEVATEASQLILDNLNRAGELIHSFKQVAVDQTSLQSRTFAIKPYLEEILTNLSSQFKQTNHTVSITGDETLSIESYPGALSQIVTNLVMNTLLHAFPNNQSGHIHIDIQTDADQYRLTYEDDGVGIQDHHLSKIFEPFFTTARHQGGSGLGLHLVYNLVTQKLQGSIIVNSHPDQGTKFIIKLPTTLSS